MLLLFLHSKAVIDHNYVCVGYSLFWSLLSCWYYYYSFVVCYWKVDDLNLESNFGSILTGLKMWRKQNSAKFGLSLLCRMLPIKCNNFAAETCCLTHIKAEIIMWFWEIQPFWYCTEKDKQAPKVFNFFSHWNCVFWNL